MGTVLNNHVSDSRRTLVSFVATFLKPEMLHVYRQTTNLERHTNWIVTRRRECEKRFPARNVISLRRHPLRWFQRAWHRSRGERPPLDAAENKQLHEICASKKAHLVHVYFGTEAARCIPFLRRAKLPKVVSFHGADLSDKMTSGELADIIRYTDLFLCRSKSLAAALASRGVEGSRIRLNYTGVPVPSKHRVTAHGGPLRIVQACRFLAKKGLDTTLHAVAALRNSGRAIHLTLAGDGEERDRLERLAATLGISDVTTFTGFLEENELGSVYLKHDIFVHPSRTTATGDREGIPNSLLEAMAHGLPVISTQHSGIPEAVTHGKTGLLIENSNSEELAAAITSLAGSPSLRSRLGSSARQEIIDRFSVTACVRALEDAYEEVSRSFAP
jgi:colanic acid/amylovoran biosynthesis glycosyltransferase